MFLRDVGWLSRSLGRFGMIFVAALEIAQLARTTEVLLFSIHALVCITTTGDWPPSRTRVSGRAANNLKGANDFTFST